MYVPLHLHSHFSLLDGLSHPSDIISVCEEQGYTACALTDHGSISGHAAFSREAKEKKIKPILGCEFYLCPLPPDIKDENNRKYSHLVVLAKNYDGWLSLVQAVSKSNDYFYYKPRLNLETLAQYAEGNWITFSGHPGSDLANILFTNGDAYNGTLKSDAKEQACRLAKKYQRLFGEGNFFIEIQRIDIKNSKKSELISNILREVSKETGIPAVATGDAHYPRKGSDVNDHRVILCANLGKTIPQIEKIKRSGEDVPLGGFFSSDNFNIPTNEEIQAVNTEEEIRNTKVIADMCEEYTILGPPRLPHYSCPDGMNENQWLSELCRRGWKAKIAPLVKSGKINQDDYVERIKQELDIIKDANLSGYFLIVQDYVNWARAQGWLVGQGRGSAGGCLVSYLTGITQIDPIQFGLLFSRFYNSARKGSLPDIDVDFPPSKRGRVIDYLRDKYGHNSVAQMATFGRLMGRGALKEVLRVHEVCDFKKMDEISKKLPQEHEIADKMEEFFEENEKKSIIKWVLHNDPARIKDYCWLNKEGKLEGEYSTYFEQAMRIEGTYKTQGKHAAGIVVSSSNLNDICPMIHDKNSDDKIAGMEYTELEAMGHVKLDILGVSALDKLMGVNDLLFCGEINDD